MPTVTLSGYYGYGNAGDEAVLAGLVRALHTVRPPESLEIVALSGRPAETEAAHGIRAVDRYRIPALLRALSKTDLLLSGGGSLLQDVTSAHSVFYYLGVVRLAQMLGKKTMFVAQGIGPLVRPRTRKLVAGVARRLEAITVRDEASAALLREIGVTKPPIEVTADPALLLAPVNPPQPWAASLIVAALRPWHGEGERIAEATARAICVAVPAARSMLLPMQPGSDGTVMEHFAHILHQTGGGRVGRLSEPTRPQSLLVPLEPLVEALAACDMVIGMRLHALILAAACAVPSVALSYDPKVTAFMAQSGQSDAVIELPTELPMLTETLRRVWETRSARSESLRARLPSLRAAALRNAEIAVSLLP
jgi:polysaccharide pyruvyl transferase CsaB